MFTVKFPKRVTYLLNIYSPKYYKYSTKPSYLHNIGTQPLQYKTVGKLLEENVIKYGDRKAIISKHQNTSLTFSEALQKADKLAAAFKLLNLNKNDRVGIWAPNIIEWYISNLACIRAGVITICLNPFYEITELKNCINKVEMKAIICGDKLQDRDYYKYLLSIAPELETSKPGQLKSTQVPTLQTVISISEETKRGVYNFDEILNLANHQEVDEIKKFQEYINPDDPCNIHFTSGTTGNPKAATISHFSLVNCGFLLGQRTNMSNIHYKVCMQVPLFHAFGTVGGVLGNLSHGSTLVLPTDGYNPQESYKTIIQEKCSMIFGTPTMYVDLLEIQEKQKGNISADVAVIGGAISPPHLLANIKKKLNIKELVSAYGLSESTPVFQSSTGEDEETNLTTVGHLHEHMEALVVDQNGNAVPFGTPGELWIRGFSNMLGFWNEETKTNKVITKNKWLKTGDQFILREDGYGKIVGRIKELIIRGGENIFPKEIEELLTTHPSIAEVQVIGLPHHRLGEEVCACIRLKPKATITLTDVKSFCKGKLSKFKIPTRIEIIDDFPKTASGKVQKYKLQEKIIHSL